MGSPGRFNSFPPLDPRLGMGLALGLELEGRLTPRGAAREGSGSVSETSTPSFVSSAASSRSGSASPVSPPDYVGLGLTGLPLPVNKSPATYHSFLDRYVFIFTLSVFGMLMCIITRFCFYTGPEASGIEGLPRTQSVSSVEEFLSAASASPRLHTFVQIQKQHAPIPLRFDDARSSSGSTTPTSTFAPTSESRSATPVAA
jgi:hypothetical protein